MLYSWILVRYVPRVYIIIVVLFDGEYCNSSHVKKGLKKTKSMAQDPANPTFLTLMQESFPSKFEGVYRGRCGTWSEQQVGPSNEEKLLQPGNDRRERIPSDNNNGLYAAVGLLGIQFGKDADSDLYSFFHGTATIIADGRYVLTCVHNLVEHDISPDQTDKFVSAQNVWFEIRVNKANGGSDIIKRYNVSKCFIYPPFYNNPTCRSGFDLAICVLDIPRDDRIIPEIRQNYGLPSLSSTSAHLTKKIAVVGFPEEFNGEKWGMVVNVPDDKESDWHQFLDNKREILVYNFVDTTNGQSGIRSPVMCESGHIIGVHTGGTSAQKKNWATRLNSSKMQWIKACLGDSYMYSYAKTSIIYNVSSFY